MAVNATAVWRVRPSGSNTNGGGYDAGIAGAATDYSQQNAAQATGTHGAGSATTTFTDSTAAAFTSAMVGNAINITGQGTYFVVTFTNASNVVVDRALGTFSAATWHLGGGWADFSANCTSSGPLVPGNIVYILGGGIPNPASYTFDYVISSQFAPTAGNSTAGAIVFANDPQTPSYKAPPDTTGGMPCIQFGGAAGQNLFFGFSFNKALGLWCVSNAGGNAIETSNLGPCLAEGCVFDQNTTDQPIIARNCNLIGCEVFSSVAPGSSGTSHAVDFGSSNNATLMIGCNIHDTVGHGVNSTAQAMVVDSIISNCRGVGITLQLANTALQTVVINNTIDGNLGNGIEIIDQASLAIVTIMNNIISNHTQAAKSGLVIDAGTTAANNLVQMFVDYNVYYNNTTDVTAISYGSHDTHGGSNPYVGQSTENYTLA